MTDASDQPDHPDESLDARLRRVAIDRWLASRFIGEAQARADVVALYALDHELSRIAVKVSQPMLAQIRFAWWREALEAALTGGEVRGHPVLLAFAEMAARRGLPAPEVLRLVDGREAAAFAPETPEAADVLAGIDDTEGVVMALAARILGAPEPERTQAAARALGLSAIRTDEVNGPAHVAALLDQANAAIATLPIPAFPAVAMVTLARDYAAGHTPPEWAKRLKLTWAVMRGRV